MKNENKLKLAKKHQENEQTKEAIVDEAKAVTAYTKQRKEELDQIKESIESLADALEVKVSFPDIEPLMKRLERLEELPASFQDIKGLAHTVKESVDKLDPISQTGFREMWELVVRQNNKIDKASKDQADRTIEKFTDLQTHLDQLAVTLKQGQHPDDFKPVRLVVGGDGVPLKFLKDMPSSRGGGGATGATVQLTDGTDNLPIGGVSTATGVVTASGDTTILTVGASETVRIFHISFVPTTASTTDRDVKLITGTTDRMGWRTNTNGGGFASSPKNGQGWIEGALGEDVILNSSGADSIRWNLHYQIV